MRCPFLREDQVKSCQASPFRKFVTRSASQLAPERCTSADYRKCSAVQESHEAHPDSTHCPFLRESLVQFCSASPVATYVPWSESPDLRCAHDGHRFCELYLAVAGPRGRGPAQGLAESDHAGTANVDGVMMPDWLYYSANHMWLDVGDDGLVHLGVDAFLARLLGQIDHLAFLTVKGVAHPTVVLTVRGVDLTLVFAHPVQIVAANTRLRFNLERLGADPYGRGWLFEAKAAAGHNPRVDLTTGLHHGAQAHDWMSHELHRLNELVHERILPSRYPEAAADGGTAAPDLVQHLERHEIMHLLTELCPLPVTPWTRQ
jgi:glycine cleavage system H lipoate-binding protein